MNETIFESIFIDIHCGEKVTTCGTIYRSPKNSTESHSEFISTLNTCLEKTLKGKKNCYIMGDLNYNLLNCDDNNVSRFVTTMYDYALTH